MQKISWDQGTAYDLFMSLEVLHNPGEFGLRAAWAAGMRSRLAARDRETLEIASSLCLTVPLHWIFKLDAPKDGATALKALAEISAAERLPVLACSDTSEDPLPRTLRRVAKKGRWTEEDADQVDRVFKGKKKKGYPKPKLETSEILDVWSQPDEYGQRYLEALEGYYEVFFAEEERRIEPAIEEGLAQAQSLAQKLNPADLLEELSQGLRMEDVIEKPKLILAPSFWIAPLVMHETLDSDTNFLLFGARPPNASLVPGENVPESLTRVFKALSVPTRLRILRFLATESMTPSQLARRLRLRPPTVIHHLQALRLAGLVQLTYDSSHERRYAARLQAIELAYEALHEFLQTDDDHLDRLIEAQKQAEPA